MVQFSVTATDSLIRELGGRYPHFFYYSSYSPTKRDIFHQFGKCADLLLPPTVCRLLMLPKRNYQNFDLISSLGTVEKEKWLRSPLGFFIDHIFPIETVLQMVVVSSGLWENVIEIPLFLRVSHCRCVGFQVCLELNILFCQGRPVRSPMFILHKKT